MAAEPIENIRRITLVIHGLPVDTSGALAVQRALAGTPGVVFAYVNAALETAYVEYDAEYTETDQLRAAIASAGFRAGEASLR